MAPPGSMTLLQTPVWYSSGMVRVNNQKSAKRYQLQQLHLGTAKNREKVIMRSFFLKNQPNGDV